MGLSQCACPPHRMISRLVLPWPTIVNTWVEGSGIRFILVSGQSLTPHLTCMMVLSGICTHILSLKGLTLPTFDDTRPGQRSYPAGVCKMARMQYRVFPNGWVDHATTNYIKVELYYFRNVLLHNVQRYTLGRLLFHLRMCLGSSQSYSFSIVVSE